MQMLSAAILGSSILKPGGVTYYKGPYERLMLEQAALAQQSAVKFNKLASQRKSRLMTVVREETITDIANKQINEAVQAVVEAQENG